MKSIDSAGVFRFEDLDPTVQARIKGGSPFAAGQDAARRFDADGNQLGDVFYNRDGTAVLHPVGGGEPIALTSEQGVDFTNVSQEELGQMSDKAIEEARHVQAIPSNAIPAEAIPAEVVAAEMRQAMRMLRKERPDRG